MKRKTKILYRFWWSVVIIVACICLAGSILSWYKRRNLMRAWKIMIQEWQAQLQQLRFPPTVKTLFSLREEYNWLNEKHRRVMDLLNEKRLSSDVPKPLEFREKLLSAQVKFKQLADIQGGEIPVDLGFPQYTGGEIPDDKDVPQLNQQLFIIEGIVSLLLKYKVDKVLSVYCQPEIEYGQKNLYKELKFKVTIQCLVKELLEILTAMANTPFITIVNGIGLEKVDDNRVLAVIDFSVIEFNAKKDL